MLPGHILVGIGYPRVVGSYDRMRAWDMTPVPEGRFLAKTACGRAAHAI